MVECTICKKQCNRNGFSRSGVQRYKCSVCGKSYQANYRNRAYLPTIDKEIVTLLKESCGTMSISRILRISPNTVSSRILSISKVIKKPAVILGRSYQMDEMITYIGYKKNKYCVAYAIDSTDKEVADFVVGKRNKRNLKRVTNTLLLAQAKEIYTDRLDLYKRLLPKTVHKVKHRGTNHIERKNLTLRTHIKRLNRKTIAYSKSLLMLVAVLKIYFWG